MNTQSNQISLYQPQYQAPFDNKKIDLLKNTICKGSTDEEFELFLHACQRTGLDPFMRQIYAVKRPEKQKDGSWREAMTIQTGIDGYRLIAERTGKYSPGREPTYTYDSDGRIISSTSYVKKQTADGTWHEVAATAFFNEYCQKTKEGKISRFWNQLGHAMIAKCAEALALRKAFPGDLSGIYTKEEMMQSEAEQSLIEDNVNQPKKEMMQPHADQSLIKDNVNKAEDKSPKKIQKHQWTELNKLIDQCDSEYQKNIWEYLDSQGIVSFEEMDVNMFNKLRKGCLGNISSKQAEYAVG